MGTIRIIVPCSQIILWGGEIPLKLEAPVRPSMGAKLWCAICQVTGQYVTNNYHLLQKFVQTPQQLFCNFYKSEGHDECHCQSYELMVERTPTYHMKEKIRPPYQGTGGAHEGFQG